ncbi:MAG: hypothetical protein V7K53_31545 [Nostoc sp.]
MAIILTDSLKKLLIETAFQLKGVYWGFQTKDARRKMQRLYPNPT